MRHIADLMNFHQYSDISDNFCQFTFLRNLKCFKKNTIQTKKTAPGRQEYGFPIFIFLMSVHIRLAGLRRESATAGSNKIKGRDRACCPVNRKKALPRELVTPLLSFVFYYVLSFVEMILLRGSVKVNTFCRRKMPIFLPHFL